MKKIFTLLVATGLLTAAANAQSSPRDYRDKPQYDQPDIPQTDRRDNHQYDERNDRQNGQWDNDHSYSNDDRYNRNNVGYGKGIQMRVNNINRKYDFKMQQVKYDSYMRRYEKIRVLRFLDAQRQQEIRMLYARAGDRRLYDRGHSNNW